MREDEEHVASHSLYAVAQGRTVAGTGRGSAPASVCPALTPGPHGEAIVDEVVFLGSKSFSPGVLPMSNADDIHVAPRPGNGLHMRQVN